MDAIFNNIFILIPLAIFIGLRILEARKKHRDSKSPAEGKRSPLVKETREPTPHWEAEKKRTSHGVSPAGVPLAQVSPSPRLLPQVDLSVAQPLEPRHGSSPKQSAPRAFPRNLENLPPLKKALVFSEILGPPKGLRV